MVFVKVQKAKTFLSDSVIQSKDQTKKKKKQICGDRQLYPGYNLIHGDGLRVNGHMCSNWYDKKVLKWIYGDDCTTW